MIDVALAFKMVLLVLLLGQDGNRRSTMTLVSAAVVLYMFKTGLLRTIWHTIIHFASRRIGSGVHGLRNGAIGRGGGFLGDVGYFFMSFFLSLFPPWRPIAATPPQELHED